MNATPLPERRVEAGTLFEEMAPARTGVAHVEKIDIAHPLKRLYTGAHAGTGVAIADVDGDGRLDLFFPGGAGKNRLYLQRAPWQFEDVTDAGSVGGTAEEWAGGATFVDIDSDGDLDIYLCLYDAPNQLFINDGPGPHGIPRFREGAKNFGLAIRDASVMATFADYDGDDDLDVYIVTYRFEPERGRPALKVWTLVNGQPRVTPEFAKFFTAIRLDAKTVFVTEIGARDYLLRNDGGRFVDVTERAGLGLRYGMGNAATWWDYDDDGRPDLYVANDFEFADALHHNKGDGTFSDALRDTLPCTAYSAMGVAPGDLDGDGREDLVVLDMAGTTNAKEKLAMPRLSERRQLTLDFSEPRQTQRNVVLLNTGTGRMLEAGFLTGMAATDWSWAVKLQDFDEDGRVDVFVTAGMTRDLTDADHARTSQQRIGQTEWDSFEKLPERREKCFAFRNLGELRFEPSGAAWGVDHEGMSFGAATADLDSDGDPDLVVGHLNEPPSLYRNRGASGRRILVRLRGRAPNTTALGAKVVLQTVAGAQVRHVNPVNGFLSCDAPELHFGLGAASALQSLIVTWPNGVVDRFPNPPADHLLTITQGTARQSRIANDESLVTPLFVPTSLLAASVHKESSFDDFSIQPLLPRKLSQLGPGQAWGDVDGDGDDDFFLGGAASEPGRLFFNEGHARYEVRRFTPFDADAKAEDQGTIFFDADKDGDLDLYVASGSYEHAPNALALADRLYLNDGHGVFAKATPGALPDDRECDGAVVAADFDRDGDVDLFVGARLVPREYPATPRSRLLRNDSTNWLATFADVTDDLAPGLRSAGLVTAALWSDADGDGRPDLLVATEWGPVKLFHNDGEKLTERTEAAGLAPLTGWWNSLAAIDADGDGDLDYAAGNLGLNTKYSASADRPALLYWGDFTGDGLRQLIEARHEGETLVPQRGLGPLGDTRPFVRERFPTFGAFARASLTDIFSREKLAAAQCFVATELRTGIFLNDGTGHFAFRELPPLAQLAPVFGIVASELDGDGHPDLVCAQNFFGPERETGRMNGGLGVALRGRGDGTFEALSPRESGIVVPGDARSLTLAEVDADARPDLVFARNSDTMLRFTRGAGAPLLRVRLRGPRGNSTAIGARVALVFSDGSREVAELAAGSGYLSQSAACVWLGLPAGKSPSTLELRWPTGNTTTHPFSPDWAKAGACEVAAP